MHYLFFLFFLFCCLKSGQCTSQNDQKERELFLNILSAWHSRLKKTLEYLAYTKNHFDQVALMNQFCLERMRNPSIHLYYQKAFDYQDEYIVFFKDFIAAADLYAVLVNTYVEKLPLIYQHKIAAIKQKALCDIAKKIVSLDRLQSYLNDMYALYFQERDLCGDFAVRSLGKERRSIISFIIESFFLKSYYKKAYIETDRLFVKNNKRLCQLQGFFMEQLYLFWSIINDDVLKHIKEIYDYEMIQYIHLYNDFPHAIVLNESYQIIKDCSFLSKEL